VSGEIKGVFRNLLAPFQTKVSTFKFQSTHTETKQPLPKFEKKEPNQTVKDRDFARYVASL